MKKLFLLLIIISTKIYSTITVTFVGQTHANSNFFLDLNNDGLNDFKIVSAATATSGGGVTIWCQNTDAYLQTNSSLAVAFNINASIGGQTWTTYQYATVMSNFYGQSLRYLGLKVVVGVNSYYGWASISSPNNGGSFYISEYAIEDTPNTPVNAGQAQSSVGISEKQQTLTLINVFPNPIRKNEEINFSNYTNLQNMIVECSDINGMLIFKNNVINGSIKISNYNIINGIYFLKIYQSDLFIESKKIIIY